LICHRCNKNVKLKLVQDHDCYLEYKFKIHKKLQKNNLDIDSESSTSSEQFLLNVSNSINS
jgi:hypothetical protein